MLRKMGASIFLAFFAVNPVMAQEAFNMLGTWKGEVTSVHVGVNPYRETKGEGPNFPAAALDFTFVIKDQQGNRFAGTSSAGSKSETLIGALSMDNGGGIMLDDDGQYNMTVKDLNTLNVCYFHANSSGKAVSCYALHRVQ